MKKSLFLIIFSLLLLTSCAKLESAGYDMGSKINSKFLDEETSNSIDEETIDLFCINKAQGLVTDTVYLLEIGGDWYLKEYFFSDGVADDSVSIRYRLGKKSGENQLHYYSTNILENNYLEYAKQQVATDGTIKGDFTFKVKYVLKKSDEPFKLITDTKYGSEIKSQRFDVVEKEYVSCKLPL